VNNIDTKYGYNRSIIKEKSNKTKVAVLTKSHKHLKIDVKGYWWLSTYFLEVVMAKTTEGKKIVHVRGHKRRKKGGTNKVVPVRTHRKSTPNKN
jgi:hypothetical protein